MVTKALLDTCIKGVGKLHKTSVFPCGIFQMKTGINRKPGDPNYDLFQLALKSTAKRLYPNYCNCDWTNQKNAVLDDRNMKKEVLESLSKEDYDKLLENLKENKELANMFSVHVNKGFELDEIVDFDYPNYEDYIKTSSSSVSVEEKDGYYLYTMSNPNDTEVSVIMNVIN